MRGPRIKKGLKSTLKYIPQGSKFSVGGTGANALGMDGRGVGSTGGKLPYEAGHHLESKIVSPERQAADEAVSRAAAVQRIQDLHARKSAERKYGGQVDQQRALSDLRSEHCGTRRTVNYSLFQRKKEPEP
ncbi:MAG: hypothetical protein JSW08_02905 [archaeon]|nr:MAG: hypothetical protein JSW08_02905 [archaeon]